MKADEAEDEEIVEFEDEEEFILRRGSGCYCQRRYSAQGCAEPLHDAGSSCRRIPLGCRS